MISITGAIGAASYLMVACGCGFAARWGYAARRSDRTGQRPSGTARFGGVFWVGVAAFYVVLAFMRLFAVAETTRKELKHLGRALGIYAERRSLQADGLWVLALIVLLIVATITVRALPLLGRSRTTRFKALALAAVGGHALLLVLRVVSLHAVDVALFGPAHGYVVLEIAFSGLALIGAFSFARHVRRWLRLRNQAPPLGADGHPADSFRARR